MLNDHRLELDLPAVHRGVRVARHVLRHFSRLQGVPDTDVDSLVLVSSELLANAIDHGGGRAALTEEDLESDVRMRLRLEINSGAWHLWVTDQGGGDAAALQKLFDDADPGDPEDDRGRGLFLMRAMVDSLAVDPSPDGRGLTVRATKAYGPAVESGD